MSESPISHADVDRKAWWSAQERGHNCEQQAKGLARNHTSSSDNKLYLHFMGNDGQCTGGDISMIGCGRSDHDAPASCIRYVNAAEELSQELIESS